MPKNKNLSKKLEQLGYVIYPAAGRAAEAAMFPYRPKMKKVKHIFHLGDDTF